MAGLALLRVLNNTELAQQEQAAVDDRQQQPVIQGLAAHLRQCWDAAKSAKQPIETRMLKALRQRSGEYEPDKLAAIRKQGGSEVYMMITEVKCRAAESWLRDILLDTGTTPWGLDTTPIPDLSPVQDQEIEAAFAEKVLEFLQASGQAPSKSEVEELKEIVAQEYRFKLLQVAQARVDRMQQKIADQFAEGGWDQAFNEFITDLSTFPAAFIKGPIVRRQRVLTWETGKDGKVTAVPGERLAPEYERVDPFRIYPEPGITNINDGYLFEHHPLTRTALSDLIGVPGYDEGAIREVLNIGNAQSWININYISEKNDLEGKFNTTLRPTEMFDALEFWGKVSGQMLLDWGLTKEEVPDAAREYDANVWVVGNYVIKAVLNYDPLGEKPYSKTSFIKTPGAFWCKSIPEVIEDLQAVCNAAARALVNNMGISSGPLVEVNIERLPSNYDVTQVYPWMIVQTLNDPMGSSAPAVRFTQPTSNADVLMQVYEKFSRLADEHSGVPAYMYGDLDVQGAGRTSSGLSMLMGAAGKGIRQVVMHIDSDIVKPIVKRQFTYNMRYDEDESIKGDVTIVPKGAINLAVKETANVRRLEFLASTANEYDMQIVGMNGRAALLREVAKGLQMATDEIVPSRDKLAFQVKKQAAMPPPPAPATGSGPSGGMEANTVQNRTSGRAM